MFSLIFLLFFDPVFIFVGCGILSCVNEKGN